MHLRWTKYIVVFSSVILLVAGLAAFFIPNQFASFNGENSTGELLIQLYGATLLGFGFANWNIRYSPVGGIYGRAIVTGNLIHFLGGAGILLGFILGEKLTAGIAAIFIVYVLLAAAYTAVLFSGGIAKRE